MIGACRWTGSHPAGGTGSSTAGERQHTTIQISLSRVYPDESRWILAESSVWEETTVCVYLYGDVRGWKFGNPVCGRDDRYQMLAGIHWTPQPQSPAASGRIRYIRRRCTELWTTDASLQLQYVIHFAPRTTPPTSGHLRSSVFMSAVVSMESTQAGCEH